MRQRSNNALLAQVHSIHRKSRQTYGRPRLHRALAAAGIKCSPERLRRMMVKHGIFSKHRRKYRMATPSRHRFAVANNLLARCFYAAARDRIWVADTTFIATREGWLYLAAIVDVYSRKVVGWSMGRHNDRHLVCAALRMAITHRRPSPGLMHHSDRGSTYASEDYQCVLKSNGLRCSMSRRGDCYDNSLMESFFHTLKVELIRDQYYPSRAHAAAAIFEYIEVF